MKAVLISIQPKWCELIALGKKTVEVRKTRPKIEPPFKVYVYCTLPPKEELFTHGCIREYARELIRLQDGRIVYDYGMRLCCDPEDRPYSQDNFLCQKVIGEFVCHWIRREYEVALGLVDVALAKTSCMGYRQIMDYADGGDLYSWNISDLVIYEKPRPLSDFYKCGAESMDELSDREELCQYCSDTGYGEYATYSTPNGPVMCEGQFCDKAYQEYLDENFALTRPPQSWCYVEGGE